MKRYRLAVLNSHPIQYFAPLYKRLANTPDIDLTVYYCSRQGLDKGFVDPGFGHEVVWDVPLLDGYHHEFLPAQGGDKGVRGFLVPFNPSIARVLWRERYDAVLLHGHNSLTNLLALATARLAGTRVFMRGETHLLLKRGLVKRTLRRFLMPLLYRLCDACLYIGTRNRAFYTSHGVPPERLFFVPYTIDNESFAARAKGAAPGIAKLRASVGLESDVPVILYASKLIRRKRPRDLLLALAELHRRGVKAALLFVGDGEERASLESEAVVLGLRNVVFAGFINQREMPSYFALADMFVLPSEDEPWGLIINEAMACGVPVVATREIGATIDLIENGKTGYSYDAGDVKALADALELLLQKPDLRESIRSHCRARMVSWSYSECVDGFRRALEVTTKNQTTNS